MGEITLRDLIGILEWETKVEITNGFNTLYEGKIGDISGNDFLELKVYLITPQHNARENYLEILAQV